MRTAAISLVLASFLVQGCRAESSGIEREIEREVERAYAAYEAVAVAMANPRDCEAGVVAALSEIEHRRPDLERAFAIQRDPERLAAARPALEAQKERFVAIAGQLDTALTRCEATPGIAAVRQLLAP